MLVVGAPVIGRQHGRQPPPVPKNFPDEPANPLYALCPMSALKILVWLRLYSDPGVQLEWSPSLCVMATMPPSILRLVRRNDERFSPQIQHHTTKIQTPFRFSIFRGELLENAVKYIYFLYMARKKTRLREIICII